MDVVTVLAGLRLEGVVLEDFEFDVLIGAECLQHGIKTLPRPAEQLAQPRDGDAVVVVADAVVSGLKLLPERARFFKGLAAWVGFSAVSVAFDRPSRRLGRTKWTYWKLWNFAIDAVTSFSSLPLKVWSYVGGLIAMLAFLYGLFIIARVVVTGRDMPGYASLITVLLFSTGVQMISLGMLGEYVSRVFLEAKQRPIYLLEGVYARGAPILSSLVARP